MVYYSLIVYWEVKYRKYGSFCTWKLSKSKFSGKIFVLNFVWNYSNNETFSQSMCSLIGGECGKNCYLQSQWSKTTCSLWPKFPAWMSLYRKVFVVSNYLPNMTSDRQILHAQSHSPGVWDHGRVHMYLVVGLCKLGTNFCVKFESQRCKIHVAMCTAARAHWIVRCQISVISYVETMNKQFQITTTAWSKVITSKIA